MYQVTLQARLMPFVFVVAFLVFTSVSAQTLAQTPDVRQTTEAAQPLKDSAVNVRGAANTTEQAGRTVVLANGTRLDSRQWPIVGRPDADRVFAMMFDYTCPHCRSAYVNAVNGARQKYRTDLAILMLPVPLERQCNSAVQQDNGIHAGACELSRLAVAVWRIAPETFAEFNDWLMTAPRTPKEAQVVAERLVGPAVLREELQKASSAKYISRQVELYQQLGAGSLPKLMFPRATLTGDIGSVSALCDTIDRECPLLTK